jgi:hypothetical protein
MGCQSSLLTLLTGHSVVSMRMQWGLSHVNDSKLENMLRILSIAHNSIA